MLPRVVRCAALVSTATERATTGDPRPSRLERYGSDSAYVRRVTATAHALVVRRLLHAMHTSCVEATDEA